LFCGATPLLDSLTHVSRCGQVVGGRTNTGLLAESSLKVKSPLTDVDDATNGRVRLGVAFELWRHAPQYHERVFYFVFPVLEEIEERPPIKLGELEELIGAHGAIPTLELRDGSSWKTELVSDLLLSELCVLTGFGKSSSEGLEIKGAVWRERHHVRAGRATGLASLHFRAQGGTSVWCPCGCGFRRLGESIAHFRQKSQSCPACHRTLW
jgi:hypothetical protein